MATDTMISIDILNHESKPNQQITNGVDAYAIRDEEDKSSNNDQIHPKVIVKLNQPLEPLDENKMCCNRDVKVRLFRFVTAVLSNYSYYRVVRSVFPHYFMVLLHIYVVFNTIFVISQMDIHDNNAMHIPYSSINTSSK